MLWYTISELSAELLVCVECLLYFMQRLWYIFKPVPAIE